MLLNVIFPALLPYPETRELRARFYRNHVQKTPGDWCQEFGASLADTEAVLRYGGNDRPRPFVDWVVGLGRLIEELPRSVYQGAAEPVPPAVPMPDHPRTETNKYLTEQFGVSVPCEIPVDELQGYIHGVVRHFLRENPGKIDELVAEMVSKVEEETRRWGVYDAEVEAHRLADFERKQIVRTRDECRHKIQERERWTCQIIEWSRLWYQRGMREDADATDDLHNNQRQCRPGWTN